MTPEEVLALLTLVARLQSLNVRYETTIAQLQQDNLALKAEVAELSEKPRKRAAANGARSESHESTRMP